MIRVELNPVDKMYEVYWGNGGRTLYGVASTLEELNKVIDEMEGRDGTSNTDSSGRSSEKS